MKASNLERSIRTLMGKAIHQYAMIQDGDRILVAVSGGKDSVALLHLLMTRLPRIPISYTLIPVYLEMGYNQNALPFMRDYFQQQSHSTYHVELTDFATFAHSPQNLKNPCFLCSRMRRKRLFQIAQEHRCNKLAFGHNQDDIIETFFLNTLYGSVLSTMRPFQPLFEGQINLIRPLSFIAAPVLERFARLKGFPLVHNACPSATDSKRTQVRELLQTLYRSNRKIRGNIFHALQHVDTEYLL
ncbi:MAG: tRNA 2-thiocytidine(32) synthetase TtcA [Deltaproteobacteria bacterium]|nr:tRNA 2-thiocytidine(32) synthetase TtcA [Deltaproteobacteria bacterium]